jgi:putative (di)nucleoside polyphosphate hydrolase
MVLNNEGLVWAGRRIAEGNTEYDGSPQLWQMPQGGIDEDEIPQQAALRELYEETGMKSVELLAEAPDWIDYDLPDHLIGIGLKGKFRGQRQRWLPCVLPAAKPKSTSTRHQAATSRNSMPGNGNPCTTFLA